MKIKFLIITTVLVMAILGFGFVTKAQTTDVSALIAQLQAQIQSLMQQIAQLQAQQNGAQQWCHTFNTYLTVGSTGTEVDGLWTALSKEGYGATVSMDHIGMGMPDTFGNNTLSALKQFQKKYGIFQTGTVGPITRAKLNKLYGCTIIPIPQPTPTPTPVPTPAPTPNPTSPVTISSCQEITKPGNYVLNNDITSVASSTASACINIHDSNNIYLNCAGHTINSVYPVNVTKTNNFSISSCNFKGSQNSGRLFSVKITSSTYGEIKNNTVDEEISVNDSSFMNAHDNSFTAPWVQIYTTNSTISNNKFALNINVYDLAQALIESRLGSNNQFMGNNIDGGSDSVWSKPVGADDSIFIADENADVIKSNTMQNTFDCGLETLGVISNATIDSNTIKNTGYCGIGAWYYNSWISNVVSNNIINSAHEMFTFMQDYGLRPTGFDPNNQYPGHTLPADTGVYFQNNQFINNKSSDNSNVAQIYINMSQVSAPGRNGEITPLPSQYILTNNIFKNNDFDTSFTPAFLPSSMIVDGGGNKCLAPSGTYPITCNGQITPVPQPTPNPTPCTSGATQSCQGNTIQTCTSNGQWPGCPVITVTPTITITSPAVGSTWTVGQQYNVTWNSNNTSPIYHVYLGTNDLKSVGTGTKVV